MAGETQQMHAGRELDAEFKQQEDGTTLEKQSEKTSEHLSSTSTEASLNGGGTKAETLEKERDCPQQREAVIRPQQTGKIDFSSLQNRNKFVTERTWSSGKGSPQSPSGKGRSREKGKRSGKTERGNPQQLYRLSIANPRTIGIAYPQQKVLPPKKLEPSRAPGSSSYRFLGPGMSERDIDLQQEELNYHRYFPENPPNMTTQSFTSQALSSSSGTSSHLHPPMSQQQAMMESNNPQPGSQLILNDCTLNASNVWGSPERTLNGANYGVSSQKPTTLIENSKANVFAPSTFQYGYNILEQSPSDSFSCNQNPQSQDITNSSLGSVHHVTHNSFSYPPGEGQNVAQSSSPFSNDHQTEERSSYTHPTQSQFIQEVASSIPCPRSLSEDSPSSDSSSSQQSEKGKTAPAENIESTEQPVSQDAAISSGSKRACHPKDTAASQRTLIQAGVQTRNIAQAPGSTMHFPNRTFSTPTENSLCNKVLNRPPHSWEGANKVYTTDQNMIQYPDMNEKFQFQSQTATDHRTNPSKSSRMPWQQIRPNSTLANPNRIDSSRPISNQKLSYIAPPSDWRDESTSHKNNSMKTATPFQNSRGSDGFSNQRQETAKHITNLVSGFKVEMNHAQMSESKNRSVYFGLNQTLATAPLRNYSYPPLQVPTMGLMRVSPYESPLPSPVHTAASSSTCSSLSPASTSPVNICSEEGQMSKIAPPHSFYHQPQGKLQLAPDPLNSQSHQFPTEIQRTLPYTPDRAKEDMLSYLQNSSHTKAALDGSKGYIDSFGMEHHQPPPPYSAHQLLASSLATANLDQLDVLLTCKQCDQNFSNLASFLGHKQYCAQHTLAQNDLKDVGKMEESRKFHAEQAKAPVASNNSLSRCPSDLHLTLLGLNKNGEPILDSENKGDGKEDPLKLNLFSSTGSLQVPLPELEMEDAKLDSLITEALNGLGYQSDNAEIDSSFIDAFVDDDLTTVKTSSNKQCMKTKESAFLESKNKQSFEGTCYDSDAETHEKMCMNLKEAEKISLKKDDTHKNAQISLWEKTRDKDTKMKQTRKQCESEDKNNKQRFLLSSKFSERCSLKSFQDSPSLRGSQASQASTSPSSKNNVKENKKKSTRGGTWSKELIHKIVQQKNKLHKLHVKGTKNLQFSLVMERLTPSMQNPAFGEYDYVSDLDDECEPVKIASQGRLNQSSRCKYTYTKQCKWRARGERDQTRWRHESKECFEMKKCEELSLEAEKHSSHQRLRRTGSRSSTSSDLSTSLSISSDSINSPKSIERTDSESEKKTLKKKESPELKSYDRSTPQKLFKESSTLALTFTKSVKKFNIDKAMHSDNKESAEDPARYHSNPEVDDLLSSSQKSRDTMKNIENSGNALTKSKTKPSHSKKETSSKASLDRSCLQTKDTQNAEEQAAKCRSKDKIPEFESHSPTIAEESDFNIGRNKKGKGGEGPRVTQTQLSGRNTLEKQSESVCMVKEAIISVNDSDMHRPPSLCTSLMDEVCLSPDESQSPLIQKDTLPLIPYSLDQEQGLAKSPLSFDTSSMFGDLTGFDSGLYSEMPIQKDGFHSIENTSNKKEEFVSSFSTFMEQRDWSIMVNPVVRDEISNYKESSEKSHEKKADYNHIPLSLSEKIIEYEANLNNSVSEDELEIKRIVNELENQLQSTKLESPPLLAQDVSNQLQMSKFSPLCLTDDSESEGSNVNLKFEEQTGNPANVKVASEPFTAPDLPWSGGFQFELLSENHSPTTNIHNDTTALKHKHLNNESSLRETSADQEAPEETKEEILEQRRYTENLMKSLEVISDSIFKKEPIISEHNKPNVNPTSSQQREETECQATDAAERQDHSEREAITTREDISSHPNINEPRDAIEFTLRDSKSALYSNVDPSVSSKELNEHRIKGHYNAKIKHELKGEDIESNRQFMESASCSGSLSHDPQEFEESARNCKIVDNSNQLNENHVVVRNYPLKKICEEPGSVKKTTHEPDCLSSSPTKVNATQETDSKPSDVISAELQPQSSSDCDKSKDVGSSQGVEIDNMDNAFGPMNGETSKQNSSISTHKTESSSSSDTYRKANISSQIVNADRPCSPLLLKPNAEIFCFNNTQLVTGQSSLLNLSQSDGLNNTDSGKMALLIEPTKNEDHLGLESIQKQEKMLSVENIKVIIEGQKNSLCTEPIEKHHCLFLDNALPNSPLSAAYIERSAQKENLQENANESKEECSQHVKSPIIKEEKLKEIFITDPVVDKTACSLIGTPELDSEIVNSSTLPASVRAEPSEVTDRVEKSGLMYDLKLSPLNYNVLPDEPCHLNQYDFLPISPAGKAEEIRDSKQRTRGDCKSCDVSIDPALVFNQAETDTAMSQSSDEPLDLQQSMKFTCLPFIHPDEIKKVDLSAVNETTSMEAFHDPVSFHPVKDVHFHAKNLNAAENKDSDSATVGICHEKTFSEGLLANPLIVCEMETTALPSEQSDNQLTNETAHQLHKETKTKQTQSNNPQTKVLCDICFMSFRTMPGLKRHKAMKHLIRAEKCISAQSATPTHQGTALIYEALQTTEKKPKDDSQTCFPGKIDGLPEISSSLVPNPAETNPVLENMATGKNVIAENGIGHQKPPQPLKAKKTNKTRKNKNSELNPDPFSDELLNILKTDILQAITPELKNNALQEHAKSTTVKINNSVTGTEEFSNIVTSNAVFENATKTPTKETNVKPGETVLPNQFGDIGVMKCTGMPNMACLETSINGNAESEPVSEENVKEQIKAGNTLHTVEKICKLTRSEDTLEILKSVPDDVKFGENRDSCDDLNTPQSPAGISPDLRTMLDDDVTFSQLFPRDEETKRKKCPRVYSKRNKRQKVMLQSEMTVDYLPPEAFVPNKSEYIETQSEQIPENQSSHCDYETISIDDAIMLNMCHNSTLKADGKQQPEDKPNDQKELQKEFNISALNPSEITVNESASEWNITSEIIGFTSCSEKPSEPNVCMPDNNNPLPAAPCHEEAQTFPSIDIQSINTTFQLPEVQFFDSEKDKLMAPPLESAEMESKEEEKLKKGIERRGRKRQEGGIKVKDKQYKCKVCFMWFLTLGELNFHKLSHNPSPPPTCYMCVQRKFSSREQLRDHLREKHAKNKMGIWTCGMCLKEISDVWMYNEHLREHATQFARRGQTQGSILGISGCLMQETAVKNFISSIMQQRPSSASRESSKATKEPDKAAGSTTGEGKSSDGSEVKAHKTKSSIGGGGKQSIFTPFEVLHKTDTSKNVEMHPNCKDPSRDCHHCGKQFPKPFKLQRHLVVHNLERIFLCHKCPVSYQEAQELKEHLRKAHEEVEELDSKHTTLYTCELCADVMHVIKKSFICSTCNYTFSKKEQFDRHMEKHLSGGNKIFKFRGVFRPVKLSTPREDDCDSPVSKKRRILSDSLPENSSDSGIASLSPLHPNQNTDTQPSKPCVSTADDATQTNTKECLGDRDKASVKTEDVDAECSQLLEELQSCIHLSSSESAMPKNEEDDLPSLPTFAEVENKSITEVCEVKKESELVCIRADENSWTASNESHILQDNTVTDLPPASENLCDCPTENKVLLQMPDHESPAVGINQEGEDEQSHPCAESKQQVLLRCDEQDSSIQLQIKPGPTTVSDNSKADAVHSCAKETEATSALRGLVSPPTPATDEDKEASKPQKKRKETKSSHGLQRVSSSSTQENFSIDSKAKKKFRPRKCANPSLQRKSDGANEYPVLSSVRDDVVSNKIISKSKNVNLSLGSRRGLLDNCVVKKSDIIMSQNGEYKLKKGPLRRLVHSPASKVSSIPMNISLNKSRPKMGVRPVESNSYRTAESQNHILSQLFGQKLTSFKIPLRKDTSEPIN